MDAPSRYRTIKPNVVHVREKLPMVRTQAVRGRYTHIVGEDSEFTIAPRPAPPPEPILFDALYHERGGFSYQIGEGELLFVANYIEMGNTKSLDIFSYNVYTYVPDRTLTGGSQDRDMSTDNGNAFTVAPETEFTGGTQNEDVYINE